MSKKRNIIQKKSKYSLLKKLDDAYKKFVLKDKPFCAYCHIRPASVVHHIHSRKFMNVRYNLKNLIPLCRYCHKFVAHSDFETFRRFLLEKWFSSQSEFDNLYIQSQIRKTLKKEELHILLFCIEKFMNQDVG